MIFREKLSHGIYYQDLLSPSLFIQSIGRKWISVALGMGFLSGLTVAVIINSFDSSLFAQLIPFGHLIAICALRGALHVFAVSV